jgi:hypothetical protein
LRNLHKLESLTLTRLISMKIHKSKGGKETHGRVVAITRTQVKT